MHYDWRFSRLVPYWESFLTGTLVTLGITILTILLGTLLGVLLGVVLASRRGRLTLYIPIDVVRALPPLVLLLFFYYLLTRQVVGFAVSSLWVAVIALSTNLAAFTADLVRSGIQNVPVDDISAGRALGMSTHQIKRYIVFPHVARAIMPGMMILYIGVLKLSSLASVINVREVVYTAQTVIADISRSLEAWCVVGLIYIALVIPATYFARRVERWVGPVAVRRNVV